jgi:hypothetical protein
MITSQNSTVVEASGNGSVGASSIVALVIFFGLIIYSAYVEPPLPRSKSIDRLSVAE